MYFGLRKGYLRERPMFTDFHGVFSFIAERKEDKSVLWELIYEL